jgi:two-component system sensor kinase FixL
MFGYSKTALINQKINVVMPTIYGKHHDKFLENYLNTNDLGYFVSEKTLIGKHKNGYIFPVYLKVKSTESL